MYAIPEKDIPTDNNSFRDLRKLIKKYKFDVRTIGIGRTKQRVIEDIKRQIPTKLPDTILCIALSFLNAKERTNLMNICKQFNKCATMENKRDKNTIFIIDIPPEGDVYWFNCFSYHLSI